MKPNEHCVAQNIRCGHYKFACKLTGFESLAITNKKHVLDCHQQDYYLALVLVLIKLFLEIFTNVYRISKFRNRSDRKTNMNKVGYHGDAR